MEKKVNHYVIFAASYRSCLRVTPTVDAVQRDLNQCVTSTRLFTSPHVTPAVGASAWSMGAR